MEASHTSQGPVDLPVAKTIFPYLGLFTLVTLDTTRKVEGVLTLHLPPLSVISDKGFVMAPSNTSPTSKNVARIFDSLAIDDNSSINPGLIPTLPYHQTFKEKRYWRIPLDSPPILAALIERLHYDKSECKEITLAEEIYYGLGFQRSRYRKGNSSDEDDEPRSGDGGVGPSGGGPSGGGSGCGGGGGPSGGGPNDDNEGGGPSGGGRGASSKRKGKRRSSPRGGCKEGSKGVGW